MTPPLQRTDPLLTPRGSGPDEHGAGTKLAGAVAIAVIGTVALLGWALTALGGGDERAEIVEAGAVSTAAAVPDNENSPQADPTATSAADIDAGVVDDELEVLGGTPVEGIDAIPDLAEATFTPGEDCLMEMTSLRVGSRGDSVSCLQQALSAAGYFDRPIDGNYDIATASAVERLQTDRKLFVDGIAGRETGLSLGIWPDEQMLVIRTPRPAPGATDLTGFPLSSVAASGPDAPPLPENSGTGKRVVYERISQRVWAVDDNERIVRSWLVAGSQYPNEIPGTHYVYSRSEMSTAWNGAAYLPKMIRWLETQRGHIGFHGIPYGVNDKKPYMSEDELGQRLSGGCQRMADLDAEFLWGFAPVGTKVVVL